MASTITRAIAATAGAALLAGTTAVIPANAQSTGGLGVATSTSTTKPTPGQRLAELLAPLVANGTITQAQADAIIAAKTAAAAARQAKITEFRTKAEPIVAAAYGMSLEQFRAARTARTLPALTAEQRTALRAQLTELATSLGLTMGPRRLMVAAKGAKGARG